MKENEPNSRENEILVLSEIKSICEKYLVNYPTTIDEDTELLNSEDELKLKYIVKLMNY
jgi:hypothetical protein